MTDPLPDNSLAKPKPWYSEVTRYQWLVLMNAPTATAKYVPKTLDAWKMLDILARARFGTASSTIALATAHSPPTPKATKKRKPARCHHCWEKAETQVKTE